MNPQDVSKTAFSTPSGILLEILHNYRSSSLDMAKIRERIKFQINTLEWKFFIITDHRPLTWLKSAKESSSKLTRWNLDLDEYDYEIFCKSGNSNKVADALSRIATIPTRIQRID
ncbi:RNase H-like domain found in reverse transcriptase [Popillia japonica]|uniref:RNase H-like domain found in reverse transcriptase n=1 Tax=Popillia japonica TaxID=7064 RepID=A0AAW1L1N2_POPJA